MKIDTAIWEAHKERLFFGALALLFALLFLILGYVDMPVTQSGAEWVGAGKTILLGIAMQCFNKARGTKGENV